MAQAALPAASALLAPVLGALSNQQRANRAPTRPQLESALPVMAASDKKRLKAIQSQADKERLYNLITQPEVLGLVITMAGIIFSNRVPFATNKERNLALQSVATTASVLLGLGYAGVGDLTTLIIALGAGGGSLLGGLIDLPDIDIPGLGDPGGAGRSSSFLDWGIPGSGLLKLLGGG